MKMKNVDLSTSLKAFEAFGNYCEEYGASLD